MKFLWVARGILFFTLDSILPRKLSEAKTTLTNVLFKMRRIVSFFCATYEMLMKAPEAGVGALFADRPR